MRRVMLSSCFRFVKRGLCAGFICMAFVSVHGFQNTVYAQYEVEEDPEEKPLELDYLLTLEPENEDIEETGLPIDIRLDAIKEAAISYGARGGLAWRSYAIRQQLELRSRSLDQIFDFRQLLIAAPSGLLIEPPIISESLNSMLIEGDGQPSGCIGSYV